MIKEEERVIESLHEILSELLANNVNIYGAAIAQPNGHIITSEFQLAQQELPSELEKNKEKQEKNRSNKKEDNVEQKSSEENTVEPSEEPEKMPEDEGGIFILAYSYSLLSEVIEKTGEMLQKGKIKSVFIKSTYTNLIVIPVTSLTNFLMIITSGKGFDYRFFTESKMMKGELEDFGENPIEELAIDYDIDDEYTNDEKKNDDIDKYFNSFKEEVPGILGIGHVGIKSRIGSYMFFGSFEEKNQEYLNNSKESKENGNHLAGLLSYLFFIGDKVIQEERHLEPDLIQLEYEHGHVILKPMGNIALIFDTEEPFQHVYIEQNLPPTVEFQQVLQNIKNTSNNLIKVYKNIDIWLTKGVKLLKKKQPQQAVEFFIRASEIKPEQSYDANYWFSTGLALGQRAKYNAAIACFEQAHREDPTHWKSWKKQAKAYCFMDKERKAIQCMRKVLKINKLNEKAWFRIGTLYYDTKKYRRALSHFKNASKLNPESEDNWDALSSTYFRLKKYRKAIFCDEKVLELHEDDYSAWTGIGWAYQKLKKYHKAIECFDRSIAMNPDYSLAWNNRGCSFYSLKNYEEAMRNYEKARELDPLLKYPWSNIGEVNSKYGNYQIALDYFEQAHRLDPKDRDYRRYLRKNNRKLNRVRKKFLQKLFKISSLNPKIPLNDINDSLKSYIQPLLSKNANLKDLLSYLIQNNKLKARISQNCLEFV